jgi:hypothetical protein
MKLVRASSFEDDVDALFRVPLAEFTGERNALAAQLKKSGRVNDALQVKALSKPSVSAWAVNQLYWNHREAFDGLLASAERFHKAQMSRGSAKIADMRAALDTRREALAHLSDLATSVLRDASHNPSPDTILRITTTLEGLSAFASRSDGPRPGRLTHDVDPPGFESLAGFSSGGGLAQLFSKPAPGATLPKSNSAAAKTLLKTVTRDDPRHAAETNKAKITAAKVSLQDAKRSLTQARANAQRLEAAQRRADREAEKAEKQVREAEEDLRKAQAASEVAATRARAVTIELKEAAEALEDAELLVGTASKELDKLLEE